MKDIINQILLTDVIEDFPAYITIYGEDYTILRMNRISRERKGLTLEDLGHIKCYELRGRSEPCENCIVTKVIESGQPHAVEALEYEGDSPLNGASSWYLKAAPLSDGDGEMIGILKVSHNISEHVQRKLQYEKNIEFLHDLVENTTDIIWTSTSRGTIEYANPALEKILGYKLEEITNRHFVEFLHPDDLVKLMDMVPKLMRKKKGWKNFTARWKHKDGTYRYLESSSTPILDSCGRVIAYRGVDRDVTRREELIAQLLQSQKMESIGRLAGGISHDFNNMLGVILGYLEMSTAKLAPSHPVSDYLKQIREAAERSINLTKQLLAFARKQKIEPEILDLNSAVGLMLKMLQRLIGSDIELAWIPGKDLWPVEMDPHQVDQIMANLCVNAKDAIEGTGKITIKTGNKVITKAESTKLDGMVPGEYVLLSVKDTGRGMERETLRKAFEPFFTTKPEGVGTGLGLSTVYGIVKQNNGFIYASSKSGEGCRFNVYLPRYTGEKKAGKGSQKNGETLRGTESILLVDDEKAILGVIKILLEDLGYKVIAAVTPLKALKIYQDSPDKFDLIIIDKIMPEMRGIELRNKIREVKPDIKYIFMSGHSAEDPEDRISIMEHDPFLQKPFTQKELSIKIREVIEGW